MSSDFGVCDSLAQLGVLVDEPGLSENIGSCIFQLKYRN